jgi:membrane associated rhomboid family serine protease
MKKLFTFVYIASCIAMFALLFDMLSYGITELSMHIFGSLALFIVFYNINRMSDARLSRKEN